MSLTNLCTECTLLYMKAISFTEFRKNASTILNDVERGDSVEILISSAQLPSYPSSLILNLEAICGGKRVVLELEHAQQDTDPDDYLCILDTTDWSAGTVNVTVYTPESMNGSVARPPRCYRRCDPNRPPGHR